MEYKTVYDKYPWLSEMEKNPTDEERMVIEDTKKMFELHPGYPEPKPIEVLNLIMKRGFAEEIARGEKKLEYRIASDHYWDRLMDKDTAAYLEKHREDKFLWEVGGNILRPVGKIHFHDYNNSWWMDVDVKDEFTFSPDKEGIEMMHNVFDNHDFDKQYKELSLMHTKYSHYPLYFVFVLGEILGSFNI